MTQQNVLYDMYERCFEAEPSDVAMPAHISVTLGGNHRWVKSPGTTASQRHRVGTGKISEFLQ